MFEEKRFTIETIEDAEICKRTLDSLGLRCEWSGLCIWLYDVTQEKIDELNELMSGWRYSMKRQAYFLRAKQELGSKGAF